MGKKLNWKKLEKYFIYLSFLFYFIFQLLESLPGSVSEVVPRFLTSSLLSLAVIIAVHYLIRLVEESYADKDSIIFNATYADAFQEWIRPHDSILDLCIVAFTSVVFLQFVQINSIKIKRLRLLLFVQDPPRPTCSNIDFDQNEVVEKWQSLHSNGQIARLEIRKIRSQSNFYFSVSNSQRALMGLLWPNPNMQDIKAKGAVIITRDSSARVIVHLLQWFDEMWKHAENIISTRPK